MENKQLIKKYALSLYEVGKKEDALDDIQKGVEVLNSLYKSIFSQNFKNSGSLVGKLAFIENEVLGKLIFSLLITPTLFLNLLLQ